MDYVIITTTDNIRNAMCNWLCMLFTDLPYFGDSCCTSGLYPTAQPSLTFTLLYVLL